MQESKKTKYILHGGNTSTPNQQNTDFYAEIGKDLPKGSQVLVCYFHRDPREWNKLYAQDSERIIKQDPGKELKIVLANEDNFMDQIRQSEAVYFRGGPTEKLLIALKKYPELTSSLQGKTVAGSSAGAYVMATHYYSDNQGGLFRCLGIVPVKVHCHHQDNQKHIVNTLSEIEREGETVLLKDCEMKVIYG